VLLDLGLAQAFEVLHDMRRCRCFHTICKIFASLLG
jgi:hypothetical protein